jgi:hypothetical protein
MKKYWLVIAAFTIVSSSAFSLTGKDRWSDIRSSRDVLIQQPTFAAVFGSQGLFNACSTEEEFRSIEPVRTCLSYREVLRGNEKDYICAEYETREVVISRTYNQSKCVTHAPMSENSSGECIEYGNSTSVYPSSFQLAVIEAQGIEYRNFIFSKTFAIPSCE